MITARPLSPDPLHHCIASWHFFTTASGDRTHSAAVREKGRECDRFPNFSKNE
ncbi:hypothetical protein ACE1CD_00500 [Aerosakkonema sp. BLCC-F183]|uniref:hypothetical protein n=1 Tax=Aerosakkonema sp. BLCC-F183 TaxID=3342834 RepID=UPI0035BA6EB9